jgi:hypothetical protein
MNIELQHTDNVDVVLWAIATVFTPIPQDNTDGTQYMQAIANCYKILNEAQARAKSTGFQHGWPAKV